MFENELREHVGQRAQIVAPNETISGVLVAVASGTLTLRTAQYPGYGNAEDVTVRIDTIAYVRFFV